MDSFRVSKDDRMVSGLDFAFWLVLLGFGLSVSDWILWFFQDLAFSTG